MPAPASNEELFALIAKSGVHDDARVRAYVDKLAAAPGGVPNDPIKLGEYMVRDGLLTHFQAEQLLQGRWKRFSIGKYKVLERLGVGGMGQVFLCEHKLMKRKVAVKVLPAAKAKDQAALQRFYREARAVAAVDHPNIVRAYDIDDDNDLHFLVMEYVDGANLHDLVRKSGPMPPLRACHYVYGAAVGLQHAYEIGLVHRDIKPANILVDRGGVVKILDMGLARFFQPDDDDHLTKKFEENVLGTADYLAPEQAMDSTSVDIRADIYGLGGTFYFMLTGNPPFPEGTVAQKLLWHQSKPPKPISAYRQDVPAQLVAIVEKMLAKEPADRFTTPADLMAALAPWVQTPIAPPTEAEIPQVSVAAGGRPPGGSNAPTAVASSRATPVSPRPTPSAPLARPLPPTPATVTLTPADLPVPDTSASANPWAELRSAETIPTAEDTTRNRRDRDPAPSRTGKQPAPTRDNATAAKKKLSPLVLAAAAAGCGLLLLGGAGAVAAVFLLGPKGNATATTAPASDKRTWYVTKGGIGPNPATTRGTLVEALRGVKSGDEVVLLDDTLETGPLSLGSVRDVRIAATPGKVTTVTYKPNEVKSPAAVIHLRGCENVTLSGLVIDVTGQHDIGVQVSGKSSGVLLDKLTVRNARKHAIQLLNVTAEPSAPLTVSGCRLIVGGGQSGVNLAGSAEIDCRVVRVTDNRFEGTGGGAGVRVEGATTDVEVRNNRLFNLDSGVLFVGGPDAPKACQVGVERNTFHTTKVGVRVDQPPAAERAVSVSRNYFAGGGVATTTADPKGVKSTSNGRDAATQPGVSAAAEVTGASVPAPPADAADDKFLRPTGNLSVKDSRIGAD